MPSTNIIEFVSFWGGIASLIALVVLAIQFLRKVNKQLKIKADEQGKLADSLRDEISELAQKGTTAQRKHEVYTFINSIINRNRHFEASYRIHVVFGVALFSLLFSAGTFLVVKMDFRGYFELPGFFKEYIIPLVPLFFLVMISSMAWLYSSISKYSKRTDAIEDGLLRALKNNIDKM